MAEYTLFGTTPGPDTSGSDGQPITLAHQITITTPCWATALRVYRGTTAITGPLTGRLWRATAPTTGTAVPGSDVTFSLSGTGWQTALLDTPIALDPGIYKAAVRFTDQFPVTSGYWTSGPGATGITSGPLTAPNNTDALDGQGSYTTSTGYPGTSGSGGGYWVDLTVTDTDPIGGMDVADYTVAEGDQGKYEIPLAANTEAVVTFAEDLDDVEISNDTGAARVYFTVDGTPATVRGANCRQLPAAIHYVSLGVYRNGGTVVRLISETPTIVSVARAAG